MNRCGVLVDLSHVGPRTSADAVRHSAKPVSYTHCCPSGLKDHPRNKSDAELLAGGVADRGGLIGVAHLSALPSVGRGDHGGPSASKSSST